MPREYAAFRLIKHRALHSITDSLMMVTLDSVEELKLEAHAALQESCRRPLMIQVKEWSG
jgi:hypothetical protein